MASVPTTLSREGKAVADVLVDPAWLELHLDDPLLRLVEVDVSPVAFADGHIRGAVLWNVYQDLKDGDYQLVDRAAVSSLLARSGITRESTVVFYGYAPAMAFWLMKLYGHDDVRILDCSRLTWSEQGRPWTANVTTPARTTYLLPDEDGRIRADHRQVLNVIGDPGTALLDVRSEAEFSGERFWPSGALEPGGRSGHVPSAINFPVEGLHDEQGRFRSAAEIAELFAQIGLPADADVVSYCAIGGRASTAWFALTYLLGRQRVRVYDGSWAEWGRLPNMPIEGA